MDPTLTKPAAAKAAVVVASVASTHAIPVRIRIVPSDHDLR
jgi:hypothetical protein